MRCDREGAPPPLAGADGCKGHVPLKLEGHAPSTKQRGACSPTPRLPTCKGRAAQVQGWGGQARVSVDAKRAAARLGGDVAAEAAVAHGQGDGVRAPVRLYRPGQRGVVALSGPTCAQGKVHMARAPVPPLTLPASQQARHARQSERHAHVQTQAHHQAEYRAGAALRCGVAAESDSGQHRHADGAGLFGLLKP